MAQRDSECDFCGSEPHPGIQCQNPFPTASRRCISDSDVFINLVFGSLVEFTSYPALTLAFAHDGDIPPRKEIASEISAFMETWFSRHTREVLRPHDHYLSDLHPVIRVGIQGLFDMGISYYTWCRAKSHFHTFLDSVEHFTKSKK